MTAFLPIHRRLLAIALLLLTAHAATAQVRVDLAFRRSLYIRFEPLIATVTVTNLSGQEIELMDDGNRKWFSFQIETPGGALVPPYNADYQLSPVQIGAGQRISRLINITPLYPISEFGVYRVKATIFAASLGKYFSSAPLNVEITEGRVLWSQTVGDPIDGTPRTITLLSHRLPDHTQLYLRIENKDAGVIYCTHQLGRYVSFSDPTVELNPDNSVNVLQNTSPKVFLYSHVELDGRVTARKIYNAASGKPALVRGPDGTFDVSGGVYVDPAAEAAAAAAAPPPPKVSDRPVPLPTPSE